ncbi:Pyridine nucleotide-disulfide oxidoreductase, FAD/NAD(P)-binding domain containing protein [Alkalidesulfovibrio alkalitolerans DSM 16529]|uniref:Pyridine nucleotide-disulfide oxidoreductase, FAD/NAD(P)-binding domain containing protein n=1 Tax=Alkalidesulfovibrio alkalitolerans DSM 16529 TaxID=1121439 RepID=S7TB50_9BACT|nr:FAD-dependent oxidoreductase [Alkalidesulfovibrio alkalitolerans]EPR34367.1 Pyridine nucleotide-disulfide oxidoreductase, FAD/NAD(P)-binding domain containing protein [Alkalidesulfovibrio alkalitolerans DSM 16529]
MGKKIVIIGAVALGPKAACRARRLDPEADILLLDRDDVISYGGCGIPYYISGDVPDRKALLTTTYHVVRDVEFFKAYKRLTVRTRVEALAIDRKARVVRVRDLNTGAEEDIPYDVLVLATGSTPFMPPVPGTDLSGCHAIATMHHADAVKNAVQNEGAGKAVVVGAGAIGIEMCEALADLWGIETTLVEMAPQVLPQALGSDFARIVQHELEKGGVRVLLSETVTEVLGDADGKVRGVRTKNAGEIECDLVIFAAGSRPNTSLAREAGLALGASGGILVDARMRTSDPKIYAGGDCVEVRHLVSGHTAHLPLGSLANRQGRVIGDNVTGGNARFEGVVGTFIIKAFELAAGRAGLTEIQARAAGFDPVYAILPTTERAHFYPGASMFYLKLIADKKTRRVLGIEAVCANGDAVKARVDAVAALLPHAPSVEDVSNLEVAYAPPFAQAMDVLNATANTLQNILDGRLNAMGVEEFLERFHKGELRVVDTRVARGAKACTEKYPDAWQSFPQECIPDRLDELPMGEDVVLFCNSGVRSYDSQCFLRSRGIDLPHVQGGWVLLKCFEPGFQALDTEDDEHAAS